MSQTPSSLRDLEHHSAFVERHIGPNDAEIAQMLDVVGHASLDAMTDAIVPGNIKSRKIAILIGDGVKQADIDALTAELDKEGAQFKLLAPSAAPVKSDAGKQLVPNDSMQGLPSVAFDAVWVPGGASFAKALEGDGVALHYLLEAYKHLKAIGLCGESADLLFHLALLLRARSLSLDVVARELAARHRARQPR